MLLLWFHKHLIYKVKCYGLTHHMVCGEPKKIPVRCIFFSMELQNHCCIWFSLWNHSDPMLSPFDAFTTKGCRTVSVGFTMSDSWRTAKWLVLQLHFDVVTCYDICQSWTKYRALYTGTWKQLECKLSNCLT